MSTSTVSHAQAIQTYEFGCAPQAVKDGYLPSVTIEHGTLQCVLSKYEGQDVAVVYGASIAGAHNEFEFAVLQRELKEARMFEFDGSKFTLEVMLESNAHDDDFCAWAHSAVIGDNFCGCVRVS